MSRSAKVRVEWSREKMASLPSSNNYSTVAKFSEDNDWPENAWSIMLEFSTPETARAKIFEAKAKFLVPNAPCERLKPDCIFELYEGFKKTATVKVL